MDIRDQASLPVLLANSPPQTQNSSAGQDISRSPSPTARRATSSMAKEFHDASGSDENLSRTLSHREQKDSTFGRGAQPAQPAGVRRPPIASAGPMSQSRRSVIDWVVPVDEKPVPPIQETTVSERLQPTVTFAQAERNKYAAKAKLTGLALNIAIGLQVVIGAMITGLSAVTTGRHTSIMTSILGGFSTIVASYLARARGSNEPELSIARVKDLEQFLRECEAFQMDHGHKVGHDHDDRIDNFRARFEELLGNGNGERKLSPPV